MKNIIVIISVFVMGSVCFADGGKKNMSLDERKAKVTANIDQRIASLNEFKTCVSSVTEKGGIKSCRKANKERMAKMKADRKAMKGK